MSEPEFEDETDPFFIQKQEENEYIARAEGAESVVAHLSRCREVYCRVFAGTASEDDIDFFMRDLAGFARTDILFFPDQRQQDRMTGRKEVIQRIVEYTGLSHDVLVKRYIETFGET